jgi:hypothetical protein
MNDAIGGRIDGRKWLGHIVNATSLATSAEAHQY